MRGDKRRTAACQLTNRRDVQCDCRAPDALACRHGLAFKVSNPTPIRSELTHVAPTLRPRLMNALEAIARPAKIRCAARETKLDALAVALSIPFSAGSLQRLAERRKDTAKLSNGPPLGTDMPERDFAVPVQPARAGLLNGEPERHRPAPVVLTESRSCLTTRL
jgi:hypothetical protein